MNRDGWTYRSEFVRCKKAACGSCPHGPYWYRYRREAGKLRKEYVGKELPEAERAAPPRSEPPRPPDIFDRITSKGGCDLATARAVLGLTPSQATEKEVTSVYRRLTMLHHPDRGGEHRIMVALNLAYAYLRSFYK